MPLCNTANQWLNRWCCKILSHLFVMDCESDELLRHWRSGLLVTFKAGLWNTTFSSLVCRDTPFFGSSIIQKHASEFVSFILTETVSPQDSSSTCGTCTSREEDDTARGKGKCTNWSTPLPCAHFKAAGFLCVFVLFLFVCFFYPFISCSHFHPHTLRWCWSTGHIFFSTVSTLSCTVNASVADGWITDAEQTSPDGTICADLTAERLTCLLSVFIEFSTLEVSL